MDFKCNKCEKGIDIHNNELFDLYEEEGVKEVQCPHCGEKIFVDVCFSHTFYTCDEYGDWID